MISSPIGRLRPSTDICGLAAGLPPHLFRFCEDDGDGGGGGGERYMTVLVVVFEGTVGVFVALSSFSLLSFSAEGSGVGGQRLVLDYPNT